MLQSPKACGRSKESGEYVDLPDDKHGIFHAHRRVLCLQTSHYSAIPSNAPAVVRGEMERTHSKN